jgi:lysine-specific demethylase 8
MTKLGDWSGIAVAGDRFLPAARRAGLHEIPRIDFERWRGVRNEAQREAMPLVIAGGVAESTAVREWSPRALAVRFDVPVDAALDLPGGRAPYQDEADAHTARIPFSELVNRIEQGERCYLHQGSPEEFDGLLGEIDLSALIEVATYNSSLWVGGKTCSGLHFDAADNVLAQIYGSKRAVLVAPKYVGDLGVLPDMPLKSGLSPQEIESECDGPLSRIERWSTILDPGDVLYIPRGWWHYLASPGASISINAWHGDVLPVKDWLAWYFRCGPRTWGRTVRDFVWSGMLGRPYQQRLFSPPPLGVDVYRMLARRNRRSSSGEVAR